MGILSTQWKGQYEDHELVVSRSELTKGFQLEWDGEEVARRRWSWIGLGELAATVEVAGKPLEVRVAIEWGGIDGTCTITVDGKPVPVEKVK